MRIRTAEAKKLADKARSGAEAFWRFERRKEAEISERAQVGNGISNAEHRVRERYR